MVDPLRPLISLLESVSKVSRSVGTPTSASSKTASSATEQNASLTPQLTTHQALVNRLTTRLTGLDRANRRQVRKAFVEIALLSELGDQLAMDGHFAELIDDVVTIISQDEQAIEELDKLLESIPA